jgi:DNA-binding transcriptional ArsR family regulator
MSRRSATSDVFSAIAEPRRRQIIDLLLRRGSLAVGTIVLALGLPQPVVSKHLGVLPHPRLGKNAGTALGAATRPHS